MVLSQHQLDAPADTIANDYTILIGLYRPIDGVRLPVTDAKGMPQSNDAIEIKMMNDE